MSKLMRAAALLFTITSTVTGTAGAGELRGSPASMERQHQVALSSRYEFLIDSAHVQSLAAEGQLERLDGNADYSVSRQVSFPYARPEVRDFLERLAADFRSATGEGLVVTSVLRVTKWQPRNAHKLSVHPAGMAFDLHVPSSPTSRAWLERTLLSLEDQGVLDATRERRPRHYHVAVFPAAYRRWAEENPSPHARPLTSPGAIVAAVAAGARSAAHQSHSADAMMLMLPVIFGLAVLVAHRRHQGDTVAARDRVRRDGGN